MKRDFDAETNELVLAARSALIQLDADLFSLKQSLREGDGKGGLRPFDRRKLDPGDRRWVEGYEGRVQRLNNALAAFDAALPNPAGL